MLQTCPKNWEQAIPLLPEGGYAWRNGADGSPFVLLLPDGGVGGATRNNLSYWRAEAPGVLMLGDAMGREWPMAWNGRGYASAAQTRPGQTLTPTIPWPIRDLPPSRAGCRNLVVLRAGDQSLHPLWLESMDGQARNWDLCLSYYGDHPEDWRDGAEYFVAQKGSKFGGLAPLVSQPGFLWEYDYVWFPDDDLLIDGSAINRMFALARQFDLQLAQPSLASGCFINHRITGQAPDCRLRFTSFVEIMAPLFSSKALAIAAPSFGLNSSGYGLDHLWPALLGAPHSKIAVIDEVAMVHTRPMGANYDIEGASNEGWDLLERFGLPQLYVTYGVIPGRCQGWTRRRGETGELV